MNHIHLESVDSTNSYVARNRRELATLTMVTAGEQTSGRGQRGNTWESAPGKNLTFSMIWKPENYPVRRQFLISEAVALAIVATLGDYGVEAMVKWPNDIYVGDRKICGILIEHSVGPQYIIDTIIGAGINLNQREFESDAPNPVSLWQLTGKEVDIETFRVNVARRITANLSGFPEDRHKVYMTRLWRGDGRMYPFSDTETGERFEACIADVAPDGMLTLLTSDGTSRRYAFKEVSFIL